MPTNQTDYGQQGIPSGMLAAGFRHAALRPSLLKSPANFFDKQGVIDAIGASAAKAMMYAANYLKKVAQNSMKSVAPGTKPSAPGEPPHAIGTNALVKKFLFALFDPVSKSFVIGPEDLPGPADAPQKLEHGAAGILVANSRWTHRRVGTYGEIRIGGQTASGVNTVKLYGAGGKLAANTLIGPVFVQYGFLSTPAQAARSQAINERLYGRPTRRITIAPRPFMGPAFETTIERIPDLWKYATEVRAG